MDTSDRFMISVLFFILMYQIMQVNARIEKHDVELISIRSEIGVK